jgi:hypothetical protein
MREVYSNAAFCIAATAAESGKNGLFLDRDMELMTPVRVELSRAINVRNKAPLDELCGSYWLSFEKHSRDICIDEAPLNQRAWVAQERFLSPRIIHFANNILFWECRESFTNETHPNGHGDMWENHRGARGLKASLSNYESRRVANGDNSGGRHEALQHLDELYSQWRKFLEFYTNCRLTRGTDVLVALNGVSREVAATLQDEMLAGLWKGRLLSELCWSTLGGEPCRSPFRTAPTWSWISVTSSIYTLRVDGSWFNMAEIKDALVDLAPSGAFKRASIELRCRPISTDPDGFWLEDYPWSKHTTKLSRFWVTATHDDTVYENHAGSAREDGMFVLLLKYRSEVLLPTIRVSEAIGIIIRPAHNYPLGCYERVGRCRLSFTTTDIDSTDIPEIVFECAELQTIELV